MLPKFQLNKWEWKEEDTCITPIWTTLPEASKACQELVKCFCKKTCNTCCKLKSLNYLVQKYVCVAEVAECRIAQKYSVTQHVIGTENMILSLNGCFRFKFIIVLRTLLFSVETYIDIRILLC